jgi:class 3 adenylate cyclase
MAETRKPVAILAADVAGFSKLAPLHEPGSRSVPLMTAEEFKAAMEKAKSVKSGYSPPTATKQ